MRRLLKRVGPEFFDDLIKLRIAERKGSGVPKAEPYRLRHLQFLAEKVSQQAISTNQLAINGHDLMTELKLKPGPQIGGIMNALLAEVIEDPLKNNRDYLLSKATELQDIDPNQLKALGAEAKDAEEKKREEDIRRKYHV
jgi:tRNA nucleotidyltransferase (CCA-adding enzyme)